MSEAKWVGHQTGEMVAAVPLEWLKPDKVDRRERIATACFARLINSGTWIQSEIEQSASVATRAADALIAELDKENSK